jgi:RNAse (barnase) inhibitor barstar
MSSLELKEHRASGIISSVFYELIKPTPLEVLSLPMMGEVDLDLQIKVAIFATNHFEKIKNPHADLEAFTRIKDYDLALDTLFSVLLGSVNLAVKTLPILYLIVPRYNKYEDEFLAGIKSIEKGDWSAYVYDEDNQGIMNRYQVSEARSHMYIKGRLQSEHFDNPKLSETLKRMYPHHARFVECGDWGSVQRLTREQERDGRLGKVDFNALDSIKSYMIGMEEIADIFESGKVSTNFIDELLDYVLEKEMISFLQYYVDGFEEYQESYAHNAYSRNLKPRHLVQWAKERPCFIGNAFTLFEPDLSDNAVYEVKKAAVESELSSALHLTEKELKQPRYIDVIVTKFKEVCPLPEVGHQGSNDWYSGDATYLNIIGAIAKETEELAYYKAMAERFVDIGSEDMVMERIASISYQASVEVLQIAVKAFPDAINYIDFEGWDVGDFLPILEEHRKNGTFSLDRYIPYGDPYDENPCCDCGENRFYEELPQEDWEY